METSTKYILGILGVAVVGLIAWESKASTSAPAAILPKPAASPNRAGIVTNRMAQVIPVANASKPWGPTSATTYQVSFDVIDPNTGSIKSGSTNQSINLPTATASLIWIDKPSSDWPYADVPGIAKASESQVQADSAQAYAINQEIMRYVALYPDSVIFTN